MDNTPEQWAYDEAWNRTNPQDAMEELARMIQQYEPHLKPVDPDEAIAAEACAQVCEGMKCLTTAAIYREGRYRDADMFKTALRAIKLYKESVS